VDRLGLGPRVGGGISPGGIFGRGVVSGGFTPRIGSFTVAKPRGQAGRSQSPSLLLYMGRLWSGPRLVGGIGSGIQVSVTKVYTIFYVFPAS